MSRPVIDLTGQTFGYLKVLGIDHKETVKPHGSRIYWLCRCECGNLCVVVGNNLKNGTTKSCGCRKGKHKHGMCHTSIYKTWENMKNRCENPNHKNFDDYGGRGIKVCERWHDFSNFYADVAQMEHFGEQGYTIDRIDVNGDYEPGNVRWATPKQQVNNRRNNIIVEYQGELIPLADAAERSSLYYHTLLARYHAGLRGADLFAQVENTNIIVEYQGEEMTLHQAAQKSSIAKSTLRYRYHAGKRGAELFKPVRIRKQGQLTANS